MKNIFCSVLILLFIVASANAQTFTISELLKLQKYNYEQFETYVSAKGYKYIEIANSHLFTSYHFAVDMSQNKASRHIAYNINNQDGTIVIEYQTSFLSEYNKLKIAAKSAGFIYSEIDHYEQGVFLTYKKNNREVSFYSSRGENSYGELLTFYEISVK
jgi:hypothetical protein